MKHPSLLDERARFSGPLRHYHRSGAQTQHLSWDEWVDGKSARSGSIKWPQVILGMMAVLTLGGIIAGLIITLR